MWPFKKKEKPQPLPQPIIDKYIIDWDKVQTLDDMKNIMKLYHLYMWYGFYTEQVVNQLGIQHLVIKT